jgi:disulfide bond formation protein DsbB
VPAVASGTLVTFRRHDEPGTAMLKFLQTLASSRLYWLLLFLTGFAFEGVALYYQYGREEMPCVLCIHVRLYMAAIILLSVLMLSLQGLRAMRLAGHALMIVIAAGLVRTSYILLGTERGSIIGACNFDLGLPAWLAPDKWWPAVFEVQTTCGYTPELLFGITMAEFLIVFSVGLLVFSLLMLALALRPRA